MAKRGALEVTGVEGVEEVLRSVPSPEHSKDHFRRALALVENDSHLVCATTALKRLHDGILARTARWHDHTISDRSARAQPPRTGRASPLVGTGV